MDKVVDDGYKYYLQSYAEKRSIQEPSNISNTMSMPNIASNSLSARNHSMKPLNPKKNTPLQSAADLLQDAANMQLEREAFNTQSADEDAR